jgi:hypothetical protein
VRFRVSFISSRELLAGSRALGPGRGGRARALGPAPAPPPPPPPPTWAQRG